MTRRRVALSLMLIGFTMFLVPSSFACEIPAGIPTGCNLDPKPNPNPDPDDDDDDDDPGPTAAELAAEDAADDVLEDADDLVDDADVDTDLPGEVAGAGADIAAQTEAQTAATTDQAAETELATTGGDPVRYSSGTYVMSETDLTLSYRLLRLEVSRHYENNLAQGGSLGVGWKSSLDQRILVGTAPDIEALYLSAQEKWDEDQATLAALEARYAQVSQALSAAASMSGASYSEAVSARAAASQKLAVAAARISSFRQQLEAARGDYEELQRQYLWTVSAVARNQGAYSLGIARAQTDVGIDRVLVQTSEGALLSFVRTTAPNWSSTSTYSNGQTNYLPSGAEFTLEGLAQDYQLRLAADGTYRLTDAQKTVRTYDLNGRLVSWADRVGNQIAFAYENGRLTKITDGANRSIALTRNPSGLVTTIVDPRNKSWSFAYDGGKLASVTDAEGVKVSYSYDAGGLKRITKVDGSHRDYEYQKVGDHWWAVATSDEEGKRETFDYDRAQKRTLHTNPAGVREWHTYDERYRTTKIEYEDATSRLFEYDGADNLVKETDEAGHVWTYGYDARQNRTSSLDPEGNSETWTYNGWNKVTSYRNPRGLVTTLTYDSWGNLTRVDHPDGTFETWGYNAQGLAETYTDRRGMVSTYGYDAAGNRISARNAENEEESYEYDLAGNLVKRTDAEKQVWTYTYNTDNKVTQVVDPLGGVEKFEYSPRKDLVKRTDASGAVVTYLYDHRHLLLRVENSLGERLEYDYRADGRVTETRLGRQVPLEGATSTTTETTAKTTTTLAAAAAAVSEGTVSSGASARLAQLQGSNEAAPGTLVWTSTTQYDYDTRGRVVQSVEQQTGVTESWSYEPRGRIATYTNGRAVQTGFTYDGVGRLEEVIDPTGAKQVQVYSPTGRVVRSTDRTGAVTEFEYDNLDRLVLQTDPRNQKVRFGWDEAGNLAWKEDQAGNRTQYTYDKAGRVTKITDALNQSRQVVYDKRGQVVQVIDEKGNATNYAYDAAGRLVTQTDALGKVTTYRLDAVGRLTETIDRTGASWVYQWNAAGRRTSVTDPYGHQTQYGYDVRGAITSMTNALGETRRVEYDGLGRVTQEVDPLGAAAAYEWDGAGNLLTSTDPMGRKTTYTYDALDRVTQVVSGNGETWSYAYDAEGRVTKVTDAKGGASRYEYDAAGNLVKETNRVGAVQSYTYDARGLLSRKVDFNGAATTYTYDALGRPLTTTFADGTSKTFRYDAAGNLTAAENESRSYEYTWDKLNRLVKASDNDLAQDVAYTYDAEGRRTGLTWLANQRTQSWTWGKAGEMLSVTDADGKVTSYTYDALLREIEKTLPNGIKSQTTYDPAGRTSLIRDVNTQGRVIAGEGYVYDASGKRTYTVDDKGRLTAYRYDQVGRLTQALYSFGSGKAQEDFEERLGWGLYPEYEAQGGDGKGTRAGIRWGFTPPSVPDYDWNTFADGLADELEAKVDVYKKYKGIVPGNHGRWQVKPGEGATAFAEKVVPAGVEKQALEAAAKRIVGKEAQTFSSERWLWVEQYDYDPNGNRTKKANGWGAVEFTYDAENHLTQAGKRTYQWDDNGNLTTDTLGPVSAVYEYSPENRIVDVNTEVAGFVGRGHRGKGWTLQSGVRYEYDAFGRRVTQAEYTTVESGHHRWSRSWNQDTVTDYLYDGLSLNVLGEFRDTNYSPDLDNPWLPWWEGMGNRPHWGKKRNSWYHSGWSNSNKYRPVSEYTWGNELVSRTDWDPSRSSRVWKNTNYYHQDVLGSTMALSDKLGNVVERYLYDVFGNAYEGTFQRANELGYTGQRYDAATGWYNYGYRDYAPVVGRFTTVDPIRDGNNWYAYVGNDPVNFVDPNGLQTGAIPKPGLGTLEWLADPSKVMKALAEATDQPTMDDVRNWDMMDAWGEQQKKKAEAEANASPPAPAAPDPENDPEKGSRNKPKQKGKPDSVEPELNSDGSVKRVTEFDENGNFKKEIRAPNPNGSHGETGWTTKEPTYNTAPDGKVYQGPYRVRPSSQEEIDLAKSLCKKG